MAIADRTVHAIIPSRGDLDITPLLAHIGFYPQIGRIDVVVGDTPYNRYDAAARSTFPLIYTQDDDCFTDLNPLFQAWPRRGNRPLVNAMTPEHQKNYRGMFTLIGFGALFPQSIAYSTFEGYKRDSLFFRESDRIMGAVPHLTVYPCIFITADARNENRYWKDTLHNQYRRSMEMRILQHPNPRRHSA